MDCSKDINKERAIKNILDGCECQLKKFSRDESLPPDVASGLRIIAIDLGRAYEFFQEILDEHKGAILPH